MPNKKPDKISIFREFWGGFLIAFWQETDQNIIMHHCQRAPDALTKKNHSATLATFACEQSQQLRISNMGARSDQIHLLLLAFMRRDINEINRLASLLQAQVDKQALCDIMGIALQPAQALQGLPGWFKDNSYQPTAQERQARGALFEQVEETLLSLFCYQQKIARPDGEGGYVFFSAREVEDKIRACLAKVTPGAANAPIKWLDWQRLIRLTIGHEDLTVFDAIHSLHPQRVSQAVCDLVSEWIEEDWSPYSAPLALPAYKRDGVYCFFQKGSGHWIEDCSEQYTDPFKDHLYVIIWQMIKAFARKEAVDPRWIDGINACVWQCLPFHFSEESEVFKETRSAMLCKWVSSVVPSQTGTLGLHRCLMAACDGKHVVLKGHPKRFRRLQHLIAMQVSDANKHLIKPSFWQSIKQTLHHVFKLLSYGFWLSVYVVPWFFKRYLLPERLGGMHVANIASLPSYVFACMPNEQVEEVLQVVSSPEVKHTMDV